MEEPQNYELSQVPLDDLLLALEVRKSSVDLCLNSPAGKASLSVHNGKLDDATFGDQSGGEAVLSMLSLRDGRYELSAKMSGPKGLNESLATIVQKKLSGEGPLKSARPPSQPPVSAPLERTGAQLPHGLRPIELRTLALINGELTALDIASREESSPAESLQAVHNLAMRGLIRTNRRGTLALGTRIPLASSRDTLHSAGGAKRLSENTSPGPGGNSVPRSLSAEMAIRTSQPVPARLRGGDSRKPSNTGYSSGPPPALAEEHVKLPGALRLRPSSVLPAGNTEHRMESGEQPREQHQLAHVREPSRPRAQIRSVLNSGTVSPAEGRSAQHSSSSKEDTLPPATPHSPDLMTSSDEPFDSPDLATQTDAAESLGPPRKKMDSEDIGPDPVVVDAAQGQLRDSQLPLPSTRLGQKTLEQLDELNEAVGSSRKPTMPSFRASKDATGDLTTGDLAVPGSVPHPNLLPGEATPSASDLPVVGRYEILARLKRGGMGSVYLCRLSGNAGFRRLFAMKVLHGHLAEHDEALDSFFHEARVLGGLHHRNIVGIADVGTPSEPYFVLEYVEGGSLAELYRATRSGRDPGLVVSVILDALNGLSAAHEAVGEDAQPLELVHCDVTPHNLLVGIDGTCQVTDFGIARTREVGAAGEVTRGKPGYVAPERLERRASDLRSDIFSLGVILYGGLTGVEPFTAETPEETMRNVLNKSIVPPSEVGFRPPPSLDWVCMKALARDPKERFQSAEEMANQLRRVASREGFLSSPTDVAGWVRKSLAPTLAARRAAAMRGTASAESRYRPSSIPPAAEETDVAPAPGPSAADNTGPLEPPASSKSFQDTTENLTLESSGKTPTSGEGGSRLRKFAVYAVLALATAALVWVALSPDAFSGVVRFSPPAGQASGLDDGRPETKSNKPSPAKNSTQSETRQTQKDHSKIVIPAIVPPKGEQ